MTLDRARHPLLHAVAQGAQWVGTDAYPSNTLVADEHEAWLEFIKWGGLSTDTCRD
jgi:hypothetical protein